MEADWSVEIGAGLPAIVVPWSDSEAGLNFVDLRAHPDAISAISETGKYPALGAALAVLNAPESQVFTSKCDAWRVTAEELDALDLGVSSSEAHFGVAAYIDVVLRDAEDFASFELHESWLRRLTAELREIPLAAALVELTLRWAQVEGSEGFAATMHVTACGSDDASALRNWEEALAASAALIAHGVAAKDLPAQSSKDSRN